MRVSVADRMEISGTTRTSDGYLVADARIARTGIYEYTGSEMGLPTVPIVRVYRPDATVFSDASMASFAHKPVTLGHPSQNVTPANYRDLSRGYTGDTVKRDGEFVRVPLIVTDEAAIARIGAGEAELSAGYNVDIDPTPGTTPTGEAYDAIMVGVIDGNHIAIVPRGRAGSQCRIGDAAWSDTPSKDKEPTVDKTYLFDGVSISVTDQALQALAKRDAQIMDLTSARDDAVAAAKTAQTNHDKALADKDAEIDALKAATLDQTSIDKLADAKSEVVSKARALVGDKLGETAGKSVADVRRAAVTARLGDAATTGKSDDYIAARFDGLVEAGGTALGDGIRATFAAPVVRTTDASAADAAYAKSVTDLNAWRSAK